MKNIPKKSFVISEGKSSGISAQSVLSVTVLGDFFLSIQNIPLFFNDFAQPLSYTVLSSSSGYSKSTYLSSH